MVDPLGVAPRLPFYQNGFLLLKDGSMAACTGIEPAMPQSWQDRVQTTTPTSRLWWDGLELNQHSVTRVFYRHLGSPMPSRPKMYVAPLHLWLVGSYVQSPQHRLGATQASVAVYHKPLQLVKGEKLRESFWLSPLSFLLGTRFRLSTTTQYPLPYQKSQSW